jgi:hypothetical protein
MAVWRETHPIWLKPQGTWKLRGGPDNAWEGVYPPDRAWHWTKGTAPFVMWSYAVLTFGGWEWKDIGLHPTLVPVAMAVSSPNAQLPWNIRI